jgi:hypothetical protein
VRHWKEKEEGEDLDPSEQSKPPQELRLRALVRGAGHASEGVADDHSYFAKVRM